MRPRGTWRQVLGSGLRLTLAGLAAGLAAALLATRFLAGQLHGMSVTDPATFAAVAALLLAVAASYLPARRATRLDPVTPPYGRSKPYSGAVSITSAPSSSQWESSDRTR